MLSNNSLCLASLATFMSFFQLCTSLRAFPSVSYACSVIGTCFNGALLSNPLLYFLHVLPLYHVYRQRFSFTPCHYDGFMTWSYGDFMLFYNGHFMTCPYPHVTVASILFVRKTGSWRNKIKQMQK
jgi:hypothetical protein